MCFNALFEEGRADVSTALDLLFATNALLPMFVHVCPYFTSRGDSSSRSSIDLLSGLTTNNRGLW